VRLTPLRFKPADIGEEKMTKVKKTVKLFFRSNDVNDALNNEGTSLVDATKAAIRKSKKVVHLYWAFRQENRFSLLKHASSCYAVCGTGNLPPDEVTIDRKQVTCPKCKLSPTERPKPEPEEKVVTPPDATRRMPKGKWPWPPGGKIHLLSPRNPQTQGSSKHKRWAVVWAHDGKTWEAFRDAGGNPETLKNVIKEKLAEIQP
jgi:hypothetical protein